MDIAKLSVEDKLNLLESLRSEILDEVKGEELDDKEHRNQFLSKLSQFTIQIDPGWKKETIVNGKLMFEKTPPRLIRFSPIGSHLGEYLATDYEAAILREKSAFKNGSIWEVKPENEERRVAVMKGVLDDNVLAEEDEVSMQPKRKRGRPRKEPVSFL